MSTIANAKVAHNYNCYNGHFIGCLHLIRYGLYAYARCADYFRSKYQKNTQVILSKVLSTRFFVISTQTGTYKLKQGAYNKK